MMQDIVNSGSAPSVAGYTGPGDIVASSGGWWGVRAYNAAYATGANNGLTIRCKSGANAGTSTAIKILTTGKLDTATIATTCAADGSITASLATTVLSITALGSGQVTIGDQITGAGVVNPTWVVSVGTCVSGAVVPPCTFNVSTTNTVSSETMSAAAGMTVTSLVDQSGSGHTATQGTVANQPYLFLNCVNTTLPCLYFLGSAAQQLAGSAITGSAQPFSMTYTGERTGAFTSAASVMTSNGSSTVNIGYTTATNTFAAYAGANFTATVSDSALHSLNILYNSASSVINVDGSETTGNPSTGTLGATAWTIGGNGAGNQTGYFEEGGFWNSSFTPTNRTNLHTNAAAYYGTP